MPFVEKSRLKKDFNRAAAQYDKHALLQKSVAHRLFTKVQERWPNSLVVLDAGAGTGFFSRFSQMYAMGYDVYALDIAWRMCELARREPQTVAINADMEVMPLKDECIDAYFSSLALQWVGSPEMAFKECFRVLKKNGELMLATIVEGTLVELEQSFAAIGEQHRIGKFMHEELLRRCLVGVGFESVYISIEPATLHYPDALTLLRSIKQIGAASKLEDRNRGILKRESLEKLNRYYQTMFSEDAWLKATWNIAYISAKKP